MYGDLLADHEADSSSGYPTGMNFPEEKPGHVEITDPNEAIGLLKNRHDIYLDSYNKQPARAKSLLNVIQKIKTDHGIQ